jgi:hypothetical protein
MPAMPRMNTKAIKIAYAVLGEPESSREEKKSKKKKRQDDRLFYEESMRIR